ncbi:MAG: prepilin peptidase [Deltaproteobacteria bacterium]|jgi:prepilin peptidase CpaA|nr:prepilin peptidase [Deltaproteobacteria bacterium]
MEANSFVYVLLSIILTIAAFFDFYNQRIPNKLTFTAILAAMLYYGYAHGIHGLILSLTGLAVGIAVLFLPYIMGGTGAGDVKLMGAVGSWLGAKAVFSAFLLTALFGGIYALLIILLNQKIFKGYFTKAFHTMLAFLLTKKYIPEPVIEDKNKPKLCYGIAIALGTFLYMGLAIAGYEFLI